ncbi:MAG TPA: GNAT family N-acetyltransferase [Terriglobales bacterium]|nr:GNAT family N-acetyltransferase [Terriglobales bacterium]
MKRIRVLVEDDVLQVAALHAKVYPGSRSSSHAIQSYFREILFRNPWYDIDLPSWVYEEDGKIVGVMGIIPRRMSLGGRPLRVAVCCQLFVDPDRRNSLAALQLLQKYKGGSQDVALVDGANRAARRIWEGLGGETLPLYNLHWVRPLRPARTLLSLYSRYRSAQSEKGTSSSPLPYLAGLLCDLVDIAFAPLVPRPEQPSEELQAEQLDARTLLSCLSELPAHYLLRPDYDLKDVQWLLDQAAKKKRHGPLQKVLVRRTGKGIVGWYLYYLNSTGLSEVLQIGALEGSITEVLNHLFDHARRRGAVALHGRMEPRFMQALSDRYSIFHDRASSILFHARNPAAKAALLAGDGFLTRLEGEWWMRFTGEPLDEKPATPRRLTSSERFMSGIEKQASKS